MLLLNYESYVYNHEYTNVSIKALVEQFNENKQNDHIIISISIKY